MQSAHAWVLVHTCFTRMVHVFRSSCTRVVFVFVHMRFACAAILVICSCAVKVAYSFLYMYIYVLHFALSGLRGTIESIYQTLHKERLGVGVSMHLW